MRRLKNFKVEKIFSDLFIFLLLIGMVSQIFFIGLTQAQTSGTIYIRADGSVDPLTAPIQRDGDTYKLTSDIYDTSIIFERETGVFPIIDGNGYTLQGAGTGTGIYLESGTVSIYDLIITGFDNGIQFVGSQTVLSFVFFIQSCSLIGNNFGVSISGFGNGTIFESDISYNTESGIKIQGIPGKYTGINEIF